MNTKNWKTTFGGFLLAAGLALEENEEPTLAIIGKGLSVVGVIRIYLALWLK